VKRPKELSLAPFWGPRYWPMWILLGFMHGAAKLPASWQLRLGHWFGSLLRLAKKRQERIARRNLELCFPELGAAARRELLDRHFAAVGMSFVEMGIG
jgi:Kdo2-lipid IVA lauroyltransferase/acyltransferase